MNEELKRQILRLIRDEFDQLKSLLYQSEVAPGTIKQRHIEANIIFSGLAADRPDGTTEVKAYFSTDTNTLNLWNGTAWVQEVFT